MNQQQRYETWLAFEKRRAKVERRYRVRIFNALQAQVKDIRNGLQPQLHVIESNIKSLYVESAIIEANATFASIKKEHKAAGFGFNEKWTQEVIAYFQTHLLNKAVLPISATTKAMVEKILSQAALDGLGAEETAKLLLQKTTELNRNRARVIVRTESVRAMNLGSMLGANESSIVLDKIWIAAHDERTRNSHRYLDANTTPLDMTAVFPNGCAFPGDPNGSGKETINCRCRLGYVPRRDANGLPIRREQATPLAVQRGNQYAALAEGFLTGFTITSIIEGI